MARPTSTGKATTTRIRLTRQERRGQLLDAGAAIVVESGADSLTMEGVAVRAGVSKALPYQHFQDAEDLLTELATREASIIADRISSAMPVEEPLESGLRRSLDAYFDMVEERGALLSAVFQYRFSSERQAKIDAIWVGTASFFGQRFAEDFGLAPRLSQAAALTFLSAVVGAQQVWQAGAISRGEAKDLLVHMTLDGMAGLASALSGGVQPGGGRC